MKTFIVTTAIAAALSLPAFADGHKMSAEELFALSNDSAAERLVDEGSMGNVQAAEMRLALSAMSAAERKTFFESDDTTRMELFEAKKALFAGNSPAENPSN